MKIYLDVLVITNIFVTYFLLQSTRFFLRRKVSSTRIVLGSVFGGFCALFILIVASPVVIAMGKILMAVMIYSISFGYRPWKQLLKGTIVFFIINFIYAGLMFALWYFVTPLGMQYRNGVAYFNVSAVTLVISTVIAYLVIRLVGYWMKKIPAAHQIVQVQIDCDGKSVLLPGFIDTGNRLVDLISGDPIWVCELKALDGLLPYSVYQAMETKQIETIENMMWKKRIRLVPMQSVGGGGIMICFRPDQIWTIQNHQQPVLAHAMIGITAEKVSDGEFSIIINEIE
jgi:stage II sporulation protein GA (sporulation sigma-E factor processing peptidase)